MIFLLVLNRVIRFFLNSKIKVIIVIVKIKVIFIDFWMFFLIFLFFLVFMFWVIKVEIVELRFIIGKFIKFFILRLVLKVVIVDVL